MTVHPRSTNDEFVDLQIGIEARVNLRGLL